MQVHVSACYITLDPSVHLNLNWRSCCLQKCCCRQNQEEECFPAEVGHVRLDPDHATLRTAS